MLWVFMMTIYNNMEKKNCKTIKKHFVILFSEKEAKRCVISSDYLCFWHSAAYISAIMLKQCQNVMRASPNSLLTQSRDQSCKRMTGHTSNPLPPLQREGGGLTSSNLAIRVGMKHFFQKGSAWTKRGGIAQKGGGGTLHFYIKFS